MKRYATLSSEKSIIQLFSSFEEAKDSAENNQYAHYVRPVDEEETVNSDDIVIDFGNSHAFAVR